MNNKNDKYSFAQRLLKYTDTVNHLTSIVLKRTKIVNIRRSISKADPSATKVYKLSTSSLMPSVTDAVVGIGTVTGLAFEERLAKTVLDINSLNIKLDSVEGIV